MAATNYTPIQLYYSTTASAAPTAGNLLYGELAINIRDGKLYYKDNGDTVQVIATKGAGTIGGSDTQIQYNNAGALAGSADMTYTSATNTVLLTKLNLTNALGATYGGTGLSSYTTGDLLYSSATNTLSKLALGTANYILTVNSAGTNVQWSAPSAISVSTATNLAGGVAGSVPYQSGASTTTFLAIGAANRVMTSSGSAPQWVTALTGLTGVSSSSITNTSLTSGRVVYSTTGGAETDSANLTFDGTTLTTTGLSNSGTSALVKLVTVGNTSFNGTTVFAAATPAKLYMGNGTVTDTTSAIGATNAVGAVASLAITPIAATNTSVTYTDAATLYIAGAPSAGTNITLTNPFALYVAAGTSYLAGNVGIGTTSTSAYRLNVKAAFTSGVAGAYIEAGEFNQSIMVLNHTNASVTSNLFQVQKSGTGVLTLDASGNLGIGASPNSRLTVAGSDVAFASGIGNVFVYTTTAIAADIGGTISLGGYYSGTTQTQWAGLKGGKNNATSGDYGGYLSFNTRANGSVLSEVGRFKSNGYFGIAVTDPQTLLHMGQGTFGLNSPYGTGSAVPAFTAALISGEIHAGSTVGSGSDGAVLRISAGGETNVGQKSGMDFNGYNTTDGGPKIRMYAGSASPRAILDYNGGFVVGNTSTSARLESYTTTAAQTAFLSTNTYGAVSGKAGYFIIGNNNGGSGGGYGIVVNDRTDNSGGAQAGYGVYVSAPYDGTNATGNTYSLIKYGVFVDDIYSYYGINNGTGNYNWGIYVKGGANNYMAKPLLIGTATNISTAALVAKGTASLAIAVQGGIADTNTGDISFNNSGGTQYWSIASNQANFYIADADFSNFAYVAQNFTAWLFGSDRRIKTDIADIEYGLDAVMAMKPRKYKMLASGLPSIGFIAQELQTVIPEAVEGEEIEYLDTDTPKEKAAKTMGVSKDTLIPVLVKAIQEQQALITQLTARITALEGA